MPDDFYDLLGVSTDAPEEEIRRAFREKAREYHPDVNDDDRASAQFKTLRRAYETLRDDEERAAYDRMGHRTYVEKRLGGLPTTVVDAGRGGSGSAAGRWSGGAGSRAGRGGESRSSSSSSSTDAGTGRRSGSQSSGSASRSAGRTGSSASASSSSASTSSEAGTGAGSAGPRHNESAGSASRSAGRTGSTASSSSSSASTGARAGTGRSRARSGTTRSRSRRSTPPPLRNAWLAVLASAVVYAAGLGWYLRANAAAVDRAVAVLRADPATAFAAGHGLADPGAPVRALVGAVAAAPTTVPTGALTPGLLLPAGAALLVASLVATVYRFGSGTAWLYPLGALAAVVAVAAAPALPASTAVVVAVGLLLLPGVATAAFLVDVGRVVFGG